METFNYDEVIELMSNCLNHLDEHIEVDECVDLVNYKISINFDDVVEVNELSYNVDDLYDEISNDFKTRLDALVTYKSKQL
tara:strand:- start:972 stop:1214 length:243 start_codon:yes stop_codon:yes gene_type:complete